MVKPVAWMDKETGMVSRLHQWSNAIPLYTAPPTIQTRVKYGNPDTLETGWITIETPAPRELSDEEILEVCLDGGYVDCIADVDLEIDGLEELKHQYLRLCRAILKKARSDK